jgi:hypothetical protein
MIENAVLFSDVATIQPLVVGLIAYMYQLIPSA